MFAVQNGQYVLKTGKKTIPMAKPTQEGSLDYLEKLNPHERDSHISFDEGPHIYTIDGDSGFTSVTKFCHHNFEEFNADLIIDRMMRSKNWSNSKYFGMTKQQIKDQWEKNRDIAAAAGTKMHYDIECFYNNIGVTNKSTEFKYFMNFMKAHKHLKPYRTEWMIWDKELQMAGSIDMIFEREDGSLDIYDWKRCKEMKTENKWQSAKTECISHLPDTNYWHYSLQLNTYKYLIEKNYGKKVNDLYLVCLHPTNPNKNYIKYRVNHLKDEMEDLMEARKNELETKE